MTGIAVLGGGAFGTALALTLARSGTEVTLWARDAAAVQAMNATRETGARLPGHSLPHTLSVTSDLTTVDAPVTLVAVPMQKLRPFLLDHSNQLGGTLIACSKGLDLETGLGPVATLDAFGPGGPTGILTGPSFAIDIALGLPTALVLATKDLGQGARLQETFNNSRLRVYRSEDVIGAELGGALKNVIALAAGIAIGAGLGDSARASVIARGFAEAQRYALSKGAEPETLQGLAGLGDLVLTCTSEKSRNFAAGLALGRREPLPQGVTVEGVATAQALAHETAESGLDMPLAQTVALVTEGRLSLDAAIQALLARPAGKE